MTERGHRAQSAGRSFETLLRYQIREHEQRHECAFDYAGTRARAVMRDGKLAWAHGVSMPDFVGSVGGHAVVFDAKTTKDATWILQRTRAHQYATLHRWATAGQAIAFFLIERRPGQCFLMRILEEPFFIDRPPSLRFDEWRSFPLPIHPVPPDGYGRYEWLHVLRTSVVGFR